MPADDVVLNRLRTHLHRPGPRTLTAMLAGLLWALAFPLPQLSIAAWIAPGLLLFTGLAASAGASARRGYIAGLTHNFIALYWLLHIPFPVGNISAWFFLSVYCALFPALWMWLCWRTCPIQPQNEENSGAAFGAGPLKFTGAFQTAGRDLLNTSWVQRQVWIFFCAASWTGLEFLRGWFLSGFPWNFLATSQFRLLPLIQIAEFTGVYGVSFLIVWVSVALASGSLVVLLRPQLRFAWKNEIAVPVLLLLGFISWGVTLTTTPKPAAARTLKLALVQPSIPQTLIFDSSESTNRFRQIMELSAAALAERPDVLIWPEASLPANLNAENFAELMELLARHGTPIIFGGLDARPNPGNPDRPYTWFNSAFLFNPSGERLGTYHKQRLVIFGEYTPGAQWFPLLGRIFPAGVGFGEGQITGPFVLPQSGARLVVNICFEDNFADLLRAQCRPDTDFVLNLTNNGWFGESAAQWQHAANALFRAIENRTPLVRCTNNGLTCWIDEHGRLREVFEDADGNIYGSGFQLMTLPLLPPGQLREPTLYHQWGDWFGWSCLAVTASGFWFARRRRPPGS